MVFLIVVNSYVVLTMGHKLLTKFLFNAHKLL